MLGKLPHRLRLVWQERGFAAQQPLVPAKRASVIADREPREEVECHAFTLTRYPRELPAADASISEDDIIRCGPSESWLSATP